MDLRNNLGGNVFPMLAGLKPFLGDASLGSNVGLDGPLPPRIAGQNVGVEPSPALNVLENAWVAVLTGPRTMSSGERVAISFRGRPRTRSFGEPTGGVSTANDTFPLPDGAMLILTVAVMADRTGRAYGGKIDPDEVVSSPSAALGAAVPDDAAVAAAVRWLTQSSGRTVPTTSRR